MSALRSFVRLTGVPRRVIAITAATSLASVAVAAFNGWPLWAYVLVVMVVWVPVFCLELVWAYRHFEYLAAFYLLVVTQLGHYGEHVVQMVQIHLLDRAGPDARGVFGALDVEWLHLGFNTWVLVGGAAMLFWFPRNRVLWVAMAFAVWHEVEHLYIISEFMRTGLEGNPGLLAEGGRLGDVGLGRPDLHFLYNTAETVPLVAAFLWQLRRVHSTWLAKAFPTLDQRVLAELGRSCAPKRVGAGDKVVTEGELGHHMYVVADGELEVVREGTGALTPIARLGPGQYFGEIAVLNGVPRTATVRATTPAELLELDGDTVRSVAATTDAFASTPGQRA